MAIGAIQGAQLSQPQASAQPPDQMGRDVFMKLLVSQLRNQDPLDPMDAREMVTQLSQLTGVEQLVTISDRIAALEIATAGLANTDAANLTGRTVTANASSVRLGSTGPADAVFQLDGRASEVKVTIRDESGQVVRTISMGDTFPGTRTIHWDGTDQSGNRAPAGRYTVQIEANDAQGNPVGTSSRITGRISGVSYENGYPELIVGEARIMLGDVVSIVE